MKDNAEHSYSDKERISGEAESYADSVDRRGCSFWIGLHKGYIAGATAERELIDSNGMSAAIHKLQSTNYELNKQLKEERNKAIDECIGKFLNWNNGPYPLQCDFLHTLESLKSDSK